MIKDMQRCLGLMVLLLGSQVHSYAQSSYDDNSVRIVENIAPPIILLGVLAAIVILAKIFADTRLKRLLIEKGLVTEEVKLFFMKDKSQQMREALKWGFVLGGAGAGMVAAQFLPFGFFTFGVIFVTMAGGFLFYYLALRNSDNEDRGRRRTVYHEEEHWDEEKV